MGRRTYTEEERRDVNARRELLAQAAKDAEENRPADVDRALSILGKYSRRNVALILVQAEERGRDIPGAVAGFHDWRRAGRMVRKGAKGYAILAPVTGKRAADSESDTDTDGRPRGFTFRHVFDVADTDPLGADAGPVAEPVRERDADERLATLLG